MSRREWEGGKLHTLLMPTVKIPPNIPPLLKVAIHYCRKVFQYTKQQRPYAPNIPLLGIPLPLEVVSQRCISAWLEAGVDTIGILFVDGTLVDHNMLVREQGIPNTLFLTHTQILRFIRKGWAPDGQEPPKHELVSMVYLMGNGSHLTK